MSRRRYISTDISIDKRVNQMGIEYGDSPVLLYTWMVPHASDTGIVTGEPFELLNMVWPGRRDKTENDVRQALEAMHKYRLILWDREKEIVYFPVASFYKYQTYIKPTNRREEDPIISGEQRESAQNAEHQRGTPQNTASLSLSPSLSLPHSKESGGIGELAQAFEQMFGRLTNGLQRDDLLEYMDKGMEVELLIHDMKLAARNNKPFNYALSIMKRHYESGIRTLAQAEQEETQRQVAAGGVKVELSASSGTGQGHGGTSKKSLTGTSHIVGRIPPREA